jgi:hypothetical protein
MLRNRQSKRLRPDCPGGRRRPGVNRNARAEVQKRSGRGQRPPARCLSHARNLRGPGRFDERSDGASSVPPRFRSHVFSVISDRDENYSTLLARPRCEFVDRLVLRVGGGDRDHTIVAKPPPVLGRMGSSAWYGLWPVDIPRASPQRFRPMAQGPRSLQSLPCVRNCTVATLVPVFPRVSRPRRLWQ